MKSAVIPEAKTTKNHIRYQSSLTWAARKNRKNETESERTLWNTLLRNKQTGYKFTRQKPIGRFIIDFYCAELCLVIEVDGSSHNNKKGTDTMRDNYLKSCGITTLRFSSNEIMHEINKVKEKIQAFITSSPVKGRTEEGF